MSGASHLTVGGAFDGHSGILSIPSSLPLTVNSLLQTYLDGVTGSITGGSASFFNLDAVTGLAVSTAGSGANSYEEITNIDSTGASASGSATGVVSVNSGVTDLVVQVPGDVTVSGVSTTDFALFGGASNVTYSVDGGAGSIVAAGGSDSIYALNTNDAVLSAGNDTITFTAATPGSDTLAAVGNATTRVFVGGSDNVTVTASDSAQASVVFLPNSGGNLDFINTSSASQTIYSGAYTAPGGNSIYAVNAVTAFGGAGGGFFVGGRGGFNHLDGGTGNSTLVGGGAGDVLTTSGANNALFSGLGAETLLGGGGSNSFFVGLEDVGIGSVQAVGDVISAANGSGAQNFVLGQLQATTLTGSTVTGASNTYNVLGAYTTTGGQAETLGGSNFTITDFGAGDNIFLLDGSLKPGSDAPSVETIQAALGGGGSQILLTDGTIITLKGVQTNQITVGLNGHQIGHQ